MKMRKEPDTAAPAGDDSVETVASTETDEPTSGPSDRRSAGGPVWLAAAAVLWLAMTLWSALTALDGPAGDPMDMVELAIGLPAVVLAALVGGAGTALAAVRMLARRFHPGPVARFTVALGTGLLAGIAASATLVVVSGGGSTVMSLGAVVAAAATLGGASAGVRASAVVAAAVAATLAVFLVTVVRDVFTSELMQAFGAGDSPASQWTAQQRLAWVTAGVSGVVAGLVAFGYLRRTARSTARGLAYLLAGGGAGLAHLLADVITRLGGARIIEAAGSLSASDALLHDLYGVARLNSALVLFFVGALAAMIAFGRTLGPAPGADVS
ncbi:MAG TPA: hypothetical protein VF174_14390 [Micromonosporaceae bacterium]